MEIRLPARGSEIRELLGSDEEIAKIFAPENRYKFVNIDYAVDYAWDFIEHNNDCVSINIVVKHEGIFHFMEIGRGWSKILWTF